ncbi:MAG: deoxyribonuclease IV [Clostridia bacterium]|nr:deoxyribonuclease IV [Clostridia bacterium]
MLKIGCHLSTEKGYTAMGEQILAMGGNTFQYFTKNPRGKTRSRTPDPGDVEGLCQMIREGKICSPLAHAPYTYNPCAADEGVRQYTKESMKRELEFLETIPGSMYNFHPGYHVGQGAEAGIRMVGEMLNEILWPEMQTMVLVETMSGKGTELGRDFYEIRQILEQVTPSLASHVGVCFDTCHVQDSGYKLEREDDGTSNVEKVLTLFDEIVGLDRLCAIHMNDTKNPCGTRKDRHDKLGEGYIGPGAFRELLNHPKLRHLPFYLETPNETEGYTKEIAMAKSWYRE